ncbi:MAG: hypothetical protein ACXWLH_00380 [Candidatus Saccharimonadales bacterium]
MAKAEKKTETKKLFEDQFDDEEVQYVFRKHPIVMRKGLVIGAFAPLVGVLPAAINVNLGLGWFFGGLVLGLVGWMAILFPYWISWYYSIMIVTDQRLIQITQKGLFHKTVVDLGLSQIQMVNYQVAGVQQTLLGYGTIMMQTYVGDLVIHEVHHPAKIQKKILNILREQGIVTKSMPVNEDQSEET